MKLVVRQCSDTTRGAFDKSLWEPWPESGRKDREQIEGSKGRERRTVAESNSRSLDEPFGRL